MLSQLAEGKPRSGTLMSNLVRAARPKVAGGDNEKTSMTGRAPELKALDFEEILGNIFVYNFAGCHPIGVCRATLRRTPRSPQLDCGGAELLS